MELAEIGIFIASEALLISGITFYKLYTKNLIESRKIVWRTFMPLENHKIEEICVLSLLDYKKILRMKEDFLIKGKNFELEGNLSFLGEYSEIKSMEEASKLLRLLKDKENLFFKLFTALSSFLTFTIFFLGINVLRGQL